MTKDEALKLALDALEPRPGMPCPEYESLTQCAITAIREALAQPEQEPFCYFYIENGEEFFAPKEAYVPDDAKPLYTTPPQRAWVGLTDEERKAVRNSVAYNPMAMTVAEWTQAVQHATEAKLKEKNT